MSGDGGDTGGGKGSGGDSGGMTGDTANYGGGAGGNSNAGFGSGGSSDFTVSGPGGYNDPSAGAAAPAAGGDIFGNGNGGSPSGFGNSDLGGLVSSGGNDGLNLAGSGPVGGVSQPMAAGGTFSSDATPSANPGGLSLVQDSNSLGTTAPSAGAGSSAAAFAAPEGVSGTPQLSDWISNPTGTTAPAPTDAGIFDSLDAAQHGAANQYADTASLGVPGASSTLPAASPASSGGSSSGGSAPSNGILGTGITPNGLGIAAAGAGLLNNLINGPKNVPAVGPLNATAANASAVSNDLLARGTQQGQQFGTPALQSGQDQVAKGQALQEYVATGKLPQGYEDQVQQAAQSAKQTIVSNYANRGLPTDPTMNSSLAQELSQVDARLPAAREQLAQQLATTGNSIVGSGNATSATGNALTGNQLLTDGLSAAGISSGVYTTLANLQNDQNKQNGQAIANFAAALNGGNKGLTVNLGKAA